MKWRAPPNWFQPVTISWVYPEKIPSCAWRISNSPLTGQFMPSEQPRRIWKWTVDPRHPRKDRTKGRQAGAGEKSGRLFGGGESQPQTFLCQIPCLTGKIQGIFTFLRAYFPKISKIRLCLKGFRVFTPETEQGIIKETGERRYLYAFLQILT